MSTEAISAELRKLAEAFEYELLQQSEQKWISLIDSEGETVTVFPLEKLTYGAVAKAISNDHRQRYISYGRTMLQIEIRRALGVAAMI